MKNEISTRAEVESYFALLPSLRNDILELKEKWNLFYFGRIAPFKICNVSKEDFIHYATSNPKWKIEVNDDILSINCGEGTKYEHLYLHTTIDFELYEMFVLKKSEKFVNAVAR